MPWPPASGEEVPCLPFDLSLDEPTRRFHDPGRFSAQRDVNGSPATVAAGPIVARIAEEGGTSAFAAGTESVRQAPRG